MKFYSSPFSRFRVVLLLLFALAAGRSVIFAAEDVVEISGDIASPGDYSVYSFSVSEESFFYFDSLTNVSGLRWSLSGPAGSVVANRSFASSENSYSPFLRLWPGNQLLTVDSAGDDTGEFAFRLGKVTSAQLLSLGSPVDAVLSGPKETEIYQIAVNAGDELFFDWISKTGGNNLRWRLVNPFGQEIFDTTFSSDLGPYTLNNAGQYYLMIEGYISSTDATSYELQVDLLGNTPPTPYAGTPLIVGTPVIGNIVTEGGQAQHIFTVAESDRYHLDSLVDNRFTWTLVGPTGTIVNNRRFDASDGAQIGDPSFRLYPGEYQMTVEAPAGQMGDYSFNLLSLGNSTIAALSVPIGDTITPARASKAYRLELAAGGRYFFDITENSGFSRTVYYRLIDPYGVEKILSSLTDKDVLSLPSPGTYFLLVEGGYADDAVSGTFEMTVHPINDTLEALTPGVVNNGQITVPGQRVIYSMSLPADGLFYLDSLTSANNPYWSLTSDEGTWKGSTRIDISDGNQTSDPVTPIPAGDYLLAFDGSGDFVGDFTFEALDLLTTPPTFSPGVAVSGTVTPASATAAYRFSGVAGQEFYLDVISRSGFISVPYLRIVDPDGQLTSTGSWTDRDRFALTKSGTHIVLVEGHVNDSGVTGNFEFNLVPITNGEQPLTTGTVVNGSITSIGQTQRYIFSLDQPDFLHFDGLLPRNDMTWSLDGPDGNVVNRRRLDLSDAENYRESFYALSAGDYTLTVDGNGTATGDYSFVLHLRSAAESIVAGDVVSGSVSPARASRMFQFNNTAGSRYYFDVQLAQFGSTAYWQLRTPSGNDLFSTTFVDVNALTLTEEGIHTLILEGRNTDDDPSGQYAFQIVPVTDGTGIATTGSTISGDIGVAGERDFYDVTVLSETRVIFDSLTERSDIVWSLSGPTGSLVSGKAFNRTDAPYDQGIYTLPAGDYVLTVDGSGQSVGGYEFRLLDLGGGTVMSPDVETVGTVTPARSMALYRLDGAAGDHFKFELTSFSSFGKNPYWKLVDPYGRNIFFNAGSTVANQALEYSGIHTLILAGQISDTATSGDFAFQATFLSNSPPAVVTGSPLSLGTTISGNLPTQSDIEHYTFNLATERLLFFDALKNNSNIRWMLTGPRGVEIVNRSLTGAEPWLDLIAGDYLLTIFSSNSTAGDFTFRLLDANSAPVLTLNQEKTEVLAPGVQASLFQFVGAAGLKVYADSISVSGFVYNPDWQLLDPYGNSLFSRSSSSDNGVITLPFDGTYQLLLRGQYYETATEGTNVFQIVSVTDQSVPLVLNQDLSGTIDHPGQVDRYPFTLPSTTRMLVDLMSNLSNIQWSLTGPTGTVVAPRNFSSAELLLTLPAGDYEIAIDGKDSATEDYSFHVINLDQAPLITLDTPVNTSVTPGNRALAYRFVGTAGEAVYLDHIATSGFVYSTDMKVINPDGTVLVSKGSNSDAGPVTLLQTGDYVYLRQTQVYDSAAAGNFEFNVRTVVDETQGITLGQTITEAIDHPGQVDHYQFTLTDATRVYFDSLLPSSQTRWSLVGPTSTVVAPRAFTSAELALDLEPGDYVLSVDGDSATLQDYSFRLLEVGSAPFLTPNVVSNGTVNPGVAAVVYQFIGTAGQRIYFDYLTRSGFDKMPSWSLLSPGLDSLFSRSFSSDAGIVTLPVDGTYTLTIIGDIYDANPEGAFSFNLVPIEEESPTPILQPATEADLVIQNIQVSPSSGLKSGDAVTISWAVSNTGSAAAASSFHDRVTVRNSGSVVVNTTLLYDSLVDGSIEASQSRARQVQIDLPDGPLGAGTLEVTVAADAFNTIPEQNLSGTAESNNSSSINFNSALAPYPDLQVGDLVIDPVGGWSPGESVTVTWRVDNTGDLATAGGWTDSIIFRNVATQATLETRQIAFTEASDGGPIGPGGNRSRQATFTIPNNANAYGLFEITATANSNQALFEHDPDTDAGLNNQMVLQVGSAADLQIGNVQITGDQQSGGLLTVSWETSNSGNANAGTFYDRVQINNLTTAESLSDKNVYYNSGAVENGLIEPGTSRSRSTTYRLPDGPPGVGSIEVIITADRYNAIKEYDGLLPAEDNNTASSGFTSGLSLYSDLVVQNLQATPSVTESGEQITITWDDRNQGTGEASVSWYDRITIVNTNTGLTVLNSLVYQNISSSGPLAGGQSVARQHVFQIPDGEAGTGALQITLVTDAVNSLFEYHVSDDAENNNSAMASVESTLAPYPDLLPIELAVDPIVPVTGETVSLNWVTTNSGTLAVSELFIERVVIRNITTDETLKTATVNYDPAVPEDGPIEAGEKRDRQYDFQIPDGPTGTGELEFTVTTDYGNRLFEYNEQKGGETNNVASISATASLADYPNLVVSAVAAPASALPGGTIEVSWTVENTGPGAAAGNWSDQIFLSPDAVSGGDQQLGTLSFNGSIPSGESVILSQMVTMPAFVSGDQWLVIKVNAGRTFYEPNFDDNTAVSDAPVNLPANLNLTLSRTGVSETAGTNAAVGHVARNTDTTDPLLVQLMTGDSELLTVPDSVVIPAGQTTASFPIGVINDFMVNGSRNVDILAMSTGFINAVQPLVVTDDDRPVLTFQVPRGEMTEGGADGDAIGYITRNANTNEVLELQMSSSYPLNASVPSTLTLQPGELVGVITIVAPDNESLDGTRTVSLQVSADGYNPVSQTIQVVDNDLPELTLTPLAESVVEGAESPATTGVIARSIVSARPVELLLIAQPATPIQLPPRVSIPAGAGQVSFNINVLDDPQVNGDRSINLIARLIADDGRILTEGGVTNFIDVFDNDGPTLTLTTDKEVVNEGETLGATVSRNTETSQPLTVQLSVDDPTELAVPTSVEIPAGQSAVPFLVAGLEDGVSDGVQAGFVEATAGGFNSGTIKVNIADGDLPDLSVSHIIVPATGNSDARAEVTWRVTNSGKVPATGNWTDRVYISKDNQLGSDLLAVSVPSTGPLGVDEFYVRNQQITLPSQPGTYHIIVITDSDDLLLEGSERNNQVSVATIEVAPSYRAFVETDVDAAPSGTIIPLRGRVFYTEDNSPALYKLATVRLRVNNTRRVFQVIADGEGNFTHDFQPLPNEAGIYSIGADHPLVDEDETQDQFRLLGMRANPKSLRLGLIPHEPQPGTIEIMNASDQPLTGLTAAIVDPPEGFDFQLSLASDLPGSGAVTLNYTVLTTITNQAHYQMTMEVRSGEGAVTRIPTVIDVSPLQPLLVANPPFLKRGMLRGTQSIVSFEVSNVGGAPSGDLAVLLPDEPWIQLASTSNIPSLEPGEMTTVTLTLNPADDLPLLRYDGQLALAGGRYGLNVPFQFRAVSDALGDLRVRVTDEYTYFVEGAPQVTNAIVRLRDAISGADVAEGVTDETGEVLLTGVPEGAYTLEAFATKHTTHRSTVTIVPGIETEAEAFISRQTVTYQWSVVPIEIEDHYRIVLESVFETEVPIPNVVIEDPYIMPLVVEGESTQFEITLRNEGLIAAENVKVIVPNDPRFLITPLIDEIGTIPAKSRMTIPVTIQLRNDAQTPSIQLAGYNHDHDHGHDPLPGLNGEGTCEVGVHDCLPKVPLGVTYTYTCGSNNVTQARKMDLTPICAGKSVYDCIKALLGAKEAKASKGNLAKAACEIIDAILACSGAQLSNCEKAAIQIACRTIVGGATGGVAGAAGGAASGAGDSLGCICDLIKDFAGTVSASSTGGGGGGGGGGTVNWGAYAGGFGGSSSSGSDCSGAGSGPPLPRTMGYRKLLGEGDTAGVCARVRIRIEQEAVMTRAAFLGTLEIENDGIDDLSGVRLTLDFRDEAGNPAEDMFVWREPVLSGISDVDGGGVVFGGSSSSVQYTFIPTREAAEFEPTIYRIGGTLRYIENGVEVVVPMLSSTITVYPEARLKLKYFQSRDVFSDDPFTDEVEPAEPFALGLIAQNIGAGAAKNFRITSAQPEIIENEKGLLIDFKIIGTTVGDETFEPTLTANLGTIEPGASQVAQWLFLSTLQGKFIEYTATFEHLDSLGAANLSLIDSVEIHELIHPVQTDRPGDDGRPDFLVNDVPDPDDFPDTLYFSEGPIAIVGPGSNGIADGTATLSQLSVGITATMPAGWGYLVMNDPGPGLELWKVVDGNDRELLVNKNVWTTDRSFPSSLPGAVRENKLHLLDFDGTGVYTLYYRPTESIPPEIVSIASPVPQLQSGPVDFIDVEFSEPINPATFGVEDLSLSLNAGVNLIDGSVILTEIGVGQYRIGGLSPLTGSDGNYALTMDAVGIEDLAGNPGIGMAIASWAKGVSAPVIVSVGPVLPNPRNTPVSSIDVEFSRDMNPATFETSDVLLALDGGENLIDGGVTITPLDTTRFQIAGLNGLTLGGGNYEIVVSAVGVEDDLGNTGVGQLSSAWTTIAGGPAFAGIERLATNPRNIVVLSLDVFFQAPIDAATFDYQDVHIDRDGGPNLVTSEVAVNQVDATTYRISNFNWVVGQQGTYTLSVDAGGIQDAAGNVGGGTVSEVWEMVTARPLPPLNLALAPDLGSSTTDLLINTLKPDIVGTTDRSDLTLRVRDVTLDQDLGAFPLTGTSFSEPLNFSQHGTHRLKVNVVDGAANVSTDVYMDVFVDTTPPLATVDPVVPTPRNSAVGSVTVRFSESMNQGSIDLTDVVLERDGSGDLIAAPIVWTKISTNIYSIGDLTGITDAPGNYELTVNLSGLEDEAGNPGEGIAAVSWQRSGANTKPTITAIPTLTADVGVQMLYTNTATDVDVPENILTWSIDPGGLGNVNIDADTGVLGWKPTRAQAPGEYPITVTVTDNGVPSLSDSRVFTVSVGDYSEIVIGTTIVETGATGALPLTLLSSVGVTNISMKFSMPNDRFTNFRVVQPLAQAVGSSVAPLANNQKIVEFNIDEGLTIVGSNRLGFIEFDVIAVGPSAFKPVTIDEFIAPKADGTLAPNILTTDGRVIVLDREPLLESLRTDGEPRVLIYGRAGDAFEIDVADGLGGTWTSSKRVPMTSNQHALSPGERTGTSSRFFRARAFSPKPPLMEMTPLSNGWLRVVGYGEPGLNYVIESNESAAPIGWTPVINGPLTNSFWLLDLDPKNSPSKIWRFKRE